MVIENADQLIVTHESVEALIGQKLSLAAFSQLSGVLTGIPFVKVIVDRSQDLIHFLNHSIYQFHGDYIGEKLLGISREEVDRRIDEFNRLFYLTSERRFYIGTLGLHLSAQGERFFTLETVEIDSMNSDMVKFFYQYVKDHLDSSLPLLFKPASHFQEGLMSQIDPSVVPRVFSHEIFSSSSFVALNHGHAVGRLRAFRSEEEYRRAFSTLEWFDILAMSRVPDDIPRVSGIINSEHTTPLSHANVLAAGWQIPNSIQIGILEQIEKEDLNGRWVDYSVDSNWDRIQLCKVDRPVDTSHRSSWIVQRIKLEEPETTHTPIVELRQLRMVDRYRYGTKAANLGELSHLLEKGSDRLTGFYRVRRPPRENLLPHLAEFLKVSEFSTAGDFSHAASEFLKQNIRVPRGLAIPFSIQQEFLESSPRIQQAIGKLKMALELKAREVDSLCLTLQSLIRSTRVPETIREYIDSQIAEYLGGVSSFVVRSSSNAEDLENFSAAGIYESINHCTTAENIFRSIKEVWASLVSPRSVRLREEVGISLDDCYMGMIIQEEVMPETSSAKDEVIGGVMVTNNPMALHDFRNVYINVSAHSVVQVVHGAELPYQYLYNVVEGGGKTISLGESSSDLSDVQKQMLQRLAFAGRLLQSHFSPDYTFSSPMDIEWLFGSEGLYILQLRPYSR